ncbi:MAG: ATP-dependent dethiobiotin synthetase BioD [Actinomycetota bacterium]
MPERIFVSGTDTGVGKTWFISMIAAELRRAGIMVSARKPVQSFEPGDGSTDAELLAAATGEDVQSVCPEHRSYPLALAPPIAAAVLDLEPIAMSDLVREIGFTPGALTFIEGVGGPLSPLADDGNSVDLCRGLDAQQVLLVSDSGLGCINRILLSAATFEEWPVMVALNRYDAADRTHRLNLDWLREQGVDVVVGPHDVARSIEVGMSGEKT